MVQQGIQVPPWIERHAGDRLIERPKLLRPLGRAERRQVSPTVPDVDRARPPMDAIPVGQPGDPPARPQQVDRHEIAVQKDCSVLGRRRRHDTERRLRHSRLLCADRHLKPVSRSDPRIRPRSERLCGEIEGMQQCSNLRDPRHPRPTFRRIEVNMPRQPGYQQRWRAARRSTSNISSQDARNREPASRHHTKVGDLLVQGPLQAKSARILPQHDERSHSTSLDSHPIHGGADATGQWAIANDAAAPTHRRRNPGESLDRGPTLPEPAIPPVAVSHEREPIHPGLRP
jgi:hypothetical protein